MVTMATEMIGWAAAVVLLLTIAAQVVKQWRDRSSQGVSPWLFAGQVTASACFMAYSVLLGNAVFALTNGLMLAGAVLGQLLYWRNQRGKPGAVKKLAGRLGVSFRRRGRRRRVVERARLLQPGPFHFQFAVSSYGKNARTRNVISWPRVNVASGVYCVGVNEVPLEMRNSRIF